MTDIILKNLKRNLQDKGKVCVVCGKRFKQETKGQRALCCSEKCGMELNKIKQSIRDNRNS